jgi:2-polyprenyl-3-methyl-5-hydroxy-6-metoxy-1,4-benzoquinol methylase
MPNTPILSDISRKNKLKLFSKVLNQNDLVLEVGSGEGWFAQQLKKMGHRVVSVDIAGTADIVGDINDWQNLGLKRGQFDAVVALELIEHVDCLESLKSLCKKDGYIMLSSPHPNWDWVMKILEALNLTQKRTSPHDNLTDFKKIAMPYFVNMRPAYIHQVAIFKN